MIRKSISITRATVLVLLSLFAVVFFAAWLANYQFPFAVMQTLCLIEKGANVGEQWDTEFVLDENDDRRTLLDVRVRLQTLTVDKFVLHQTSFDLEAPRTIDLGPIRYVRWGRAGAKGGFESKRIEIAVWFLWPMFAAWPVWAFVHGPLSRWHRRKHGCCLHCGYNLTGLAKPRCPECGNDVKSCHQSTLAQSALPGDPSRSDGSP